MVLTFDQETALEKQKFDNKTAIMALQDQYSEGEFVRAKSLKEMDLEALKVQLQTAQAYQKQAEAKAPVVA